MIAADEWHKYQESYVKYGIDLAPETEERPKKAPAREPAVKISAKEKGRILLAIMAIGICCIAVIFMQACASSINYSVYSLNQEISVLEGDIDNLHVQLNSYAALDYVENYATENLGMIYPGSDQYVDVAGMEGSAEVEAYIAELTEREKGLPASAGMEHSVSGAAKRLLSGPSAS